MAEVDFSIGHKSYTLSCQEGEERLLKRAASLLDAEARVILDRRIHLIGVAASLEAHVENRLVVAID